MPEGNGASGAEYRGGDGGMRNAFERRHPAGRREGISALARRSGGRMPPRLPAGKPALHYFTVGAKCFSVIFISVTVPYFFATSRIFEASPMRTKSRFAGSG